MDGTFDDLKRSRDAKLRELEREGKKRALEESKKQTSYREAAETYHQMVTDVLTELTDALHLGRVTDAHVKDESWRSLLEVRWEIQEKVTHQGRRSVYSDPIDSTTVDFIPRVRVQIVFDGCNPIGFLCSQGSYSTKHQTSGMSKAALIQALKKLFAF